MSLIDRIAGAGRGGGRREPVRIHALRLASHCQEAADQICGLELDPMLLCARLADGYRDAGMEPMAADDVATRLHNLDGDGLRRFALAVSAASEDQVIAALPKLAGSGGAAEQVDTVFFAMPMRAPLLTPELVRESILRAEEYARHFINLLGAEVEGESHAASRDRLARLDYGKLLAAAERAKVSAEERAEYLRKLIEEQEKRMAPRGKW